MQSINEFETIKKLNLDCTIVVINNSALGFVKFGQAMLYRKNYYDTDRPNTDFSKIFHHDSNISILKRNV